MEQRRADNPRHHTHGMHNWPDWITLLLGVWLFFAPLASNSEMTSTAAWNHFISGGAIAAIALFALIRPWRVQEWVNLALGVWVFLAPFLLGFWNVGWALWNHVAVGVLVIGLATYALIQHQRLLRTTH